MVLIALIIYFGSCIGLACSQTYAQIVALRCLQAAGIAPVIAINTKIVSDFALKPQKRGVCRCDYRVYCDGVCFWCNLGFCYC